MKSIGASLKAHYAQETTTLAYLWKVTRTDGNVYGFTNHDQNIEYDGVTYEAATGFDPTQIETRAELNVDDLEVAGFLDSASLTEADLVARLWDHAEVYIYRINWADTSQGVEILRRGWLGEITHNDFGFRSEVRGLMAALAQDVVEVSTPSCRATLGDSRCGVQLNPAVWAPATAYTAQVNGDAATGSVVSPSAYNGRQFVCTTAGTSGSGEPTWDTTIGNTTADGSVVWTAIEALTLQGTVTALVLTQRTFEDTGLAQAAQYFQGGVVTWVTGANAGLSMEIKEHTNASPPSAVINLVEPMPYVINPGDTYTITPGCLKRALTDCRDKFNNIWNFRGEPNRPTADDIIRGPTNVK